MTHDELLAEIKSLNDSCSVSSRLGNALKAVVELHKPVEVPHNDYATGLGCSAPSCLDKYAEPSPYPCETIQAIEKELK